MDTNLSGTLLKNSYLYGAKFLKKSITQAKISWIEVSLFIIFKTKDLKSVREYFLRKEIVLGMDFFAQSEELICVAIYFYLKDLETIEVVFSTIKEIYAMSFYADEHKKIRSLIPEHFWKDPRFKEEFEYLIDF